MLFPCSRIQIGDIQFDFVTDVEINSSWESLTQTATITLPKNLIVDGKPLVEGVGAVFKVGDKVRIELGYNLQFDTVFEGFVSYVQTNVPVVVQCEDGMFLFKRHTYKKTFKQVTVKTLVDYLCSQLPEKPQVRYSFPNLALGNFRIGSGATGAAVFEELRSTYGIYSFFRDNVLYVGFAVSHSDTTPGYRQSVDYYFEETIIDDDLQFRTKDNTPIKIQATSILPSPGDKDKSFSVEAGQAGGKVIQLNFYNIKSKEALQRLANNELEKYDVTGFQGSFTAFGKPHIRQGDAAVLHDDRIQERNGTYLVKAVRIRYGTQAGYRRDIELERKLS